MTVQQSSNEALSRTRSGNPVSQLHLLSSPKGASSAITTESPTGPIAALSVSSGMGNFTTYLSAGQGHLHHLDLLPYENLQCELFTVVMEPSHEVKITHTHHCDISKQDWMNAVMGNGNV